MPISGDSAATSAVRTILRPNPAAAHPPNPLFSPTIGPPNLFSHGVSELPRGKFASFDQSPLFYSTSSSEVVRRSGGGGDGGRRGGEERRGEAASWIDVYLLESVRPYARLARVDRPIRTWLLAWPGMWSITLAASPGRCYPFLAVVQLLQGAGCTVNDLLDRDIDVKVERTKSMPVASGIFTPFQGLSFLGLQLLLGLGILLTA